MERKEKRRKKGEERETSPIGLETRPQKVPVVRCRVTITSNNLKVVLSWYDEKKKTRVNLSQTGGQRGYVNTKRGSVHAGNEVRAKAGKRFRERMKGKEGRGEEVGVHVRRRGMGRGRVQALNELKKAGVEILTVSDATKDPHNGCRRKKRRRI